MKTSLAPAQTDTIPPTSYHEITWLQSNWTPYFLKTYPDEVQAAQDAWALASLGKRPASLKERIELDKLRTSLPEMWAAFFRPRPDGVTGIDLALRRPRLGTPTTQAALRRLAQARGTYAEALDLNPRARTLVLRDLFTQEIYRVTVPDPSIFDETPRWLRFFGVLVDIGDGTWTYVSAFTGSQQLKDLSPEGFIRVAQGGLALSMTLTGQDPAGPAEIDPAAPHDGLRRHCGVAFPAVSRWLREQPLPAQPLRYATTSEGHRFEPHNAKIRLSAEAARGLFDALARAEGFVQTGPRSYDWVSRAQTTIFPAGESVGSVRQVGDGFAITADSAQRYEALLERLAQIAGGPPEVVQLKVSRPWEEAAGFVAEPGPGVQEIALASSSPGADRRPPTQEEHLRQSLDRHNRLLQGTPRELVKTPEGRAAVEAWLRKAEESGQPGPDGARRYLDLDPLRAELGLPLVRDLIVHGTGGRGV